MSPIVYILSREQNLSHGLSEYLKKLGCIAKVTRTPRSIKEDLSYLVVFNLDDSFGDSKTLLRFVSSNKPKTVIVSKASDENNDLGNYTKQIFVDNVVPGYSPLVDQLYKSSKDDNIYIPKEGWFAACLNAELFEKISRELFSFAETKKILFGKLYSYREFFNKLNPKASVYINTNLGSRLPRKDIKIEESKSAIGDIVKSLGHNSLVLKPAKRHKTINIKIKNKLVIGLSAAILWIICVPYALLLLGGASTFIGYKLFVGGDIKDAFRLVKIANASSTVSYDLLSRFYMPFSNSAEVLVKGNSLFLKVISIADRVKSFQENPKKVENIKDFSEYLHLELDSLYRELGYFQNEPGFSLIPEKYFKGFDLEELRSYVLAGSKLSQNIPELLGYEMPKTYLLMLQNNMELRPTGGFLGSFALLTFSKGELINQEVYDVYSADGQLKGYIKPPGPIVEHLGEASWKLRDSNWDPDFPTSAERVEWFLDKTLDRSVDGVIAINLETVKKYLEAIGPLYLTSFDDTIDSKNMYEKIQFEVEDDFFPGSRKKAHYLSALSEALTQSVQNIPLNKSFDFLSATMSSLKSRDIQIYLHDKKAGLAVNEQGWDGSTPDSSCHEPNCTDVFSGFVEANLGVNKANYYIKREVKTSLSVNDENFITQNAELKIINQAPDKNHVPEQRYKAYVRAIAPKDSIFISAFINDAKGEEPLNVDIDNLEDRVEYGALADVLPGEEKTISFKWRLPLNNENNSGLINFKWWKQSGVSGYPFEVLFDLAKFKEIKSTPSFRLTQEGNFIYNTTLIEDLVAEIEWKK